MHISAWTLRYVYTHTQRRTQLEFGADSSVLTLSKEDHNRLVKPASDTESLNIRSGLM